MKDINSTSARGVDVCELYGRVRDRFISVASSLSAADGRTQVPATPAWSVHDVLAHVVGVSVDLNGQRFPSTDDVGGTRWSATQVSERKAADVPTLIEEWRHSSRRFQDGLRMFGDAVGGHFVADLYTHLNDVLHALGRPPEIDEVVIEVALDHYLGFVGEMLDASEWGIVELCSERSRWQLGTAGLRRAELSGSAFELLRVFSARRSIRQIRALHWTGDIDALLVLLDRGFQDGYTLPMLDMIEAS